jgi:hypothetical protein
MELSQSVNILNYITSNVGDWTVINWEDLIIIIILGITIVLPSI